MQRNTIKLIKETRGKLNNRFDMTVKDAENINAKRGNDLFGCMFDSFVLGYAQGMKAARKEVKTV